MTEPNLLQEIQADIDRQKWEDLWKRHGAMLVGCVIAIIVGAAGSSAWHSWQLDKQQIATNGLIAITGQPGDDAAKTKSLEDFAQKNPGMPQAVFAKLQAAALAVKDSKTDEAVKIYNGVAADTTADEAFRQFATLMSVKTQMDSGDPAKLSERLQPLTAEKAPWHFTALEYQGYLALKAGDKAKAKQIFTSLSQDASAPQTLSARAADMLHSLTE